MNTAKADPPPSPPPDSKPERPLNRVEWAYATLKRMILDDELTSGTQLLESEIATLLGMSRTPVREAIIRLSRDGLVERRARHGMRVMAISAADMKEMCEVMTALEPVAANLAATRRPTAAELAPIAKAVADMHDALARDDIVSWADADERFHIAISDLSGNSRIQRITKIFWERSRRARRARLNTKPKPIQSTLDHEAVFEAIRRGDAAGFPIDSGGAPTMRTSLKVSVTNK